MEIDELKIELIQKIIACNDAELLNELGRILDAAEIPDKEGTTIEFIPDAEGDETQEPSNPDKKL